MPKKLGIALGSGGSRGVAHVGFLQALYEAGITADCVSGCSMGAIVGACYCAGLSTEKMKEVALSLKLTKIASLSLNPLRSGGLFKLNKAKDLIKNLIGDPTFDQLKIPFACVATDLIEGKVAVLKEGNVIDAALASSSIPGAFAPATFGEYTQLVDGGILERVPVQTVKKMGAEVVVAVDVLGDLTVKKSTGGLVNSLLRCIDIRDTHSTQHKRKTRAHRTHLWLEPDLGDMDQYKVKNLDFAYEKGYEIGVQNREKIKELIEL